MTTEYFDMPGEAPEIKIKEIPAVLKNRDCLFRDYQDINEQIETLEKRKDDLKKMILETLDEAHTDCYRTKYGTYFKNSRTNYTYTDRINIMQEDIAMEKQKEIEAGIAKATTKLFLSYKGI